MLTCKEILNLKDELIVSYFDDTPIKEFLEPILVKFPDYYNLRGQELQQISDSERKKAIEILISEMR
jgi:hypothetical protein